MFTFGLAASQGGQLPAADMPDRQHIHRVVRDAVIDEVANTTYEQARDAGKASSLVFGADSRLFSQKCEALRDVIADCAWRRKTVLAPPLRCGGNVLRSAR